MVAMYSSVWRSISCRVASGWRRACQAVIRAKRSSKDSSAPLSSVLAPRAVTAMKRQVDGAKELGEPFGPGLFIGHVTRVPAGLSVVNPDG